MTDIFYADESDRIMGAGLEVHEEKGCGFREAPFQECLEREFGLQGKPFAAQAPLALADRGRPLKQRSIADSICFETIIVELKAVEKLADEHRARMLHSLNATSCRLGLWVNFGLRPKLDGERLVR